MKPFTKKEAIAVTLIFLFVASITFFNLTISIRRARDAQRKADLGAISDALQKYHDDFGFFPPSLGGKILACKGGNFESLFEEIKKDKIFNTSEYFEILKPCEWGKDSLRDVGDESYEPYLRAIPRDPQAASGLYYLYFSNTERFQLFSFLEGRETEDGYDRTIVKRNLNCGMGLVCSFGKSYGDTPLDISLEEYEQILLEKDKTGN